jgi:hypothetical protein
VRKERDAMRGARAVITITIMALVGAGLAACGGNDDAQADELAKQLTNAGYTNVVAAADYDTTTTRSKKKKKTKKKLDDFEATAKAGTCEVTIEQDAGSTDYVVETAAGKDVTFANLTADALVAELGKQGVKC